MTFKYYSIVNKLVIEPPYKMPSTNQMLLSDSPLTNTIQEYSDFSMDKDNSHMYHLKSNMYILLNDTLNMSPGKVASHVGRATEKLGVLCKNYSAYKAYVGKGAPKIIVSVPTEEKFIEILEQTKHKPKVYIIDSEGSNRITIVGFAPIFDNEVPTILKTLPLYD